AAAPVKRTNPVLLWGGWVAALACLFYAVHVRDINQNMEHLLAIETAQLNQTNAAAERAREVVEALTSPESQRVTLVSAHAQPEPSGEAVYLENRGALVFTASHLVPLPPNKTYELWVIPANGSAPIPAGTFHPDAQGMASVLLPHLPKGIPAKAFGVTMENAGGSATPTLPILLAGG
ncbi:MAG: anti-sigma factor, partial [Acidobacteriota bacterium]